MYYVIVLGFCTLAISKTKHLHKIQELPFVKNFLKLYILPIKCVFIIEFHAVLK